MDETDENFGKLLEEYKLGNINIVALKEKFQNMQSLLSVEEEQIKNRNKKISELQEELHGLQMTATSKEGQVRRRTEAVNDLIFQVEKYAGSQRQLSDETRAIADKYKHDTHVYELNDKREDKLKKMQESQRHHAIPEVQNEFSVVSGSHIDRPFSMSMQGDDIMGVMKDSRPQSLTIHMVQSDNRIAEDKKEDCLSDNGDNSMSEKLN